MKKSLLAFVLAFSLVLSVAVPAFAATPADVVGKKEQSAIEELVALGIINGYADGTFKPDNNITRAEVAKIVVEGTGSGSAAALVKGVKSTFTDVKTNEWYTGYINVAVTKGYILGDKGTGKFRPNDNIKFEEVVAIINRALGYQDSKLLGVWPYNVLVNAEDLGLFNKVDVATGTLANRAVVAQIFSNSLTKQTVVWNKDTERFEGVGGTTAPVLLINKLGTSVTKTLNAVAVDNNKIALGDLDGTLTTDTTVASNYVVTGGKKLSQLLGHEVSVLLNKDGQVLAITDVQNADRVSSGSLSGAYTVGANLVVKVGTDTKTYATATANTFTTQYAAYRNGDKLVAGNTIVDGSAADVYFTKAGAVRAVVGKQVDASDARFASYIAKTSTNDARVTYIGTGNVVDVNDNTAVTVNGEAALATDLKTNDILVIVKNNAGKALEISATREVVSGKVTSVSKIGSDSVYTVNGVAYKDVRAAALKTATPIGIGGEFKLFLNKDKNIAFAEVITPAVVDNNLAIVLDYDAAPGGVIEDGKVVTNKGILKYYSVKEDKILTVTVPKPVTGTTVTLPTGTEMFDTTDEGTYVKLHFVDSKVAYKVIAGQTDITVNANLNTISDATATTIKLNDNSIYNISANTVVVNATDAIDIGTGLKSDPKVAKTELSKVTKNDVVYVVADASGYNAAYIFLIKDNESTTDRLAAISGQFVKVIQNSVAADEYTYQIVLKINGTETTFDLERTTANATAIDALFTLNADNNIFIQLTDTEGSYTKYDAASIVQTKTLVDGNTIATEVVTSDISYNTFTVGTTAYVATANTVVYVVDKDNNVTIGAFADVVNADFAAATTYDVFVFASANKYGSNTEAQSIVIKKFS